MARFKIVIIDDRFESYEEEKKVLESIDAELVFANCSTCQEVIEASKDADGILVDLAPMPADVIEKLERCKVISRYGVGYDNLDVDACTRKRICLTNVPDYCTEEVSDHALALLMACSRKVARRDAQVRSGLWNIGNADPMYRMAGKVFTFLGFGKTGRCLYRKIRGFGFSRILIYDPFLDTETIRSMGAEKAGWSEALGEADFISMHMPLNEKTRGIIDSAAFEMMKPSAILINTSRGSIIDEKALINALTNSRINSAGLDVHAEEPLDKSSPFMKIENCVLTDHTGWYSEEAMSELKRKAAQNIKDVLLTGISENAVNRLD